LPCIQFTSIRAVSRAAGRIVQEVRRQFRVPGVWEGTVKPDYAQVVGISTASAQKELLPLAAISVDPHFCRVKSSMLKPSAASWPVSR